MKKLWLSVGLIIWVSPMIWATPSTLIWIPSTDIQAQGTAHLGIDNYATLKRLRNGKAFPFATNPALDIGLTWGLPGNIEAGIDYFPGTDDPLFLNAKALLLREREGRPNLAVGIYNVGTDRDTTAYHMVYALASKSLPAGSGRVHLGMTQGTGRRHLFVDSKGNRADRSMLLLGYDRQINPKWWVGVDYQSGKSAFGAFNVGAAYSFSPNTSVILGVDFYNDSGYEPSLTAQLDINF
ncbi:MAG: hypothetical protein IT210_20855 [Armatimonadetes bacterium]|nr:hypothetical protein [Armatimonadota bacterium]